jgi:hypothetical protein
MNVIETTALTRRFGDRPGLGGAGCKYRGPVGGGVAIVPESCPLESLLVILCIALRKRLTERGAWCTLSAD